MRTMTKLSIFSHNASGNLRQPLAAYVYCESPELNTSCSKHGKQCGAVVKVVKVVKDVILFRGLHSSILGRAIIKVTLLAQLLQLQEVQSLN